MRVVLARRVRCDLEEIGDWIAKDDPKRAVTFVRRIRELFTKIGAAPTHYQLRPDIGDGARLAVVERYVILFRIDADAVRIERVLFSGRDLPTHFR